MQIEQWPAGRPLLTRHSAATLLWGEDETEWKLTTRPSALFLLGPGTCHLARLQEPSRERMILPSIQTEDPVGKETKSGAPQAARSRKNRVMPSQGRGHLYLQLSFSNDHFYTNQILEKTRLIQNIIIFSIN